MTGVAFQELLDGFEYASAGDQYGVEVYVHREQGTIHIRSDGAVDGMPDPGPADLETGPYLQLPNQYDLDLGRQLAIDFMYSYLPDDVDQVYAFFRRRGAWRNFRELVEERGVLQQWYAYQASEKERRLRQWCADNGIALLD